MEERKRRKIYNELALFLSTSSILNQNLRAYKCETLFKMTRHFKHDFSLLAEMAKRVKYILKLL